MKSVTNGSPVALKMKEWYLNPKSAKCFGIIHRRSKKGPDGWTGFPAAHPDFGLLWPLEQLPPGFGWTQAAGAGDTENLEVRVSFPSCFSEGDLLSLLISTTPTSTDVSGLSWGTAVGPIESFLTTFYRFVFSEKRQESAQYPDTDFHFLQCNFLWLDLKFILTKFLLR